MEHEIRGRLEAYIDYLLTERGLKNVLGIISRFKPAVSSIEDAIFGWIIGSAFSFYVGCIDNSFKRDINDDEVLKFYNIMDLRALRIKSKISEIINL